MANESPLPPEWQCLEGKVFWVQSKGREEWTSSCPVCGDSGHTGSDAPDRFVMWTSDGHPRAWCRRCDKTYYPDNFGDDRFPKPNHEQIEQWRQTALEREREAEKRATEALAQLRRQERWIRWHDSMDDSGVAYWARRGVPRYMQDVWMLGMNPQYRLWTGSEAIHLPTATIPLVGPDMQVHNVKHRLLSPPEGFGKYRYELSGAGQDLFYCEPDAPMDNHVIVIEGEIKAMVTYVTLARDGQPVIGLPGTNPKMELLTDALKDADRITLIMDPGARQPAWELCKKLGISRCRVLIPPMKIDDGIVAARFDKGKLERMIANAKPAGRVT